MLISAAILVLSKSVFSQSANSESIRVGNASILPDINSTQATVNGNVQLWQKAASEEIIIDILIKGLTPGSTHGMHIHGAAVAGQNCTLAASHWNPLNATHGAPTNTRDKRHFGDLGNFKADDKGIVQIRVRDKLISFFGDYPIKDGALTFVVHQKQDDLGLNATSPDSLKTGNCGSRLSCGVISARTITLNYTDSTPASNTSSLPTAKPGSGLYPVSYQVPVSASSPTVAGSSAASMQSSQPASYNILSSARSLQVTGSLVAAAAFAALLC